MEGEAKQSRGAIHGGLLRLKGIFKDNKILVDMNRFLDKLSERELISTAQEKELKKKTYLEQTDEVFYILFATNTRVTYDCVLNILKEIKRDDIIAELQQPLGKSQFVSDIITKFAILNTTEVKGSTRKR